MPNESLGFESKWLKPYNKAKQNPFKGYTSETGLTGINSNFQEITGMTQKLEDNLRSQLDFGDQLREYTQPRVSNIAKWTNNTQPSTDLNQGLGKTAGTNKNSIGVGNYMQGALGLAGGISALSDINNSSLNTDQKRMLGADSAVNTISNVASGFGPVGQAIGAGLGLINSIGGALIGTPKEIKNFAINDTIAASGAYSGIASDASNVKASGDTYAKSGLFGKLFGGKNKIISKTKLSNYDQNRAGSILTANTRAMDAAANSQDLANTNYINTLGGADRNWTNGSIMYGQEGGKLHKPDLKSIKTIVKNISLQIEKLPLVIPDTTLTVTQHKHGGSLKSKMRNVIVSGKLHAHKHTLKEIDEFKDAEITLKGIPVITKDAEGGVIQHSEVEGAELVLHYDLTMELEELRKDGSEEAALKAGKLLARELMRNTKDKTGTLRSIRDKVKEI